MPTCLSWSVSSSFTDSESHGMLASRCIIARGVSDFVGQLPSTYRHQSHYAFDTKHIKVRGPSVEALPKPVGLQSATETSQQRPLCAAAREAKGTRNFKDYMSHASVQIAVHFLSHTYSILVICYSQLARQRKELYPNSA